MLLPAAAFNPGIFLDSTFRVIGSSDATKKIAFEVDAQSTGAVLTFNTGAQTTSRSLSVPALTADDTLATIGVANVFTANQSITRTTNAATTFTITNSSAGTGADARNVLANDSGLQTLFILGSSGNTGTFFTGRSRANSMFVGSGSALNALCIGFIGQDKPIVFGSNSTEVATLTSGVLASGKLDVKYTTAATTTTTGALTVAGGVGVAGAVYAANLASSALTSGRVTYASTAGLLTDNAGLLFTVATTATLTVGNTTNSGNVTVNGAATNQPGFFFQTGGVNKWLFRLDSTAESGGDAGANFTLVARNDAGSNIDTPLTVNRVSGGAITMARPVTLSTASTGLTIAATSGTTLTVSSTADSTSSSTGCALFSGGTYTAKNSLMGQGMGFGVTSTATAASTTTLTTASRSVQVFTGTTTQTVTLPAANAFGAGIGVVFIIKNRSTGNVTINRAGSDTIDGGTSTTLTGGANASVTLASNGVSEWVIV